MVPAVAVPAPAPVLQVVVGGQDDGPVIIVADGRLKAAGRWVTYIQNERKREKALAES